MYEYYLFIYLIYLFIHNHKSLGSDFQISFKLIICWNTERKRYKIVKTAFND